ncbi:hypothetical protein AGLY_015408, partial [Aphis glycines]
IHLISKNMMEKHSFGFCGFIWGIKLSNGDSVSLCTDAFENIQLTFESTISLLFMDDISSEEVPLKSVANLISLQISSDKKIHTVIILLLVIPGISINLINSSTLHLRLPSYLRTKSVRRGIGFSPFFCFFTINSKSISNLDFSIFNGGVGSFGAISKAFVKYCFPKLKSQTIIGRVINILAQLITKRGSFGSMFYKKKINNNLYLQLYYKHLCFMGIYILDNINNFDKRFDVIIFIKTSNCSFSKQNNFMILEKFINSITQNICLINCINFIFSWN